MKRVAILQARTSSRRLPGKMLLPLGGQPLAVLAAKRAANRGLTVIAATSTDPSDDLLASTLQLAGISTMRGPLDDVLRRFIIATSDFEDDATVLRLTADNAFPDGDFLQELIASFESRNLRYLISGSPVEGVPYGLSAEVFTAGTLREADRQTSSLSEREHVTTWLRKQARESFIPASLRTGLGHLRCTIDCPADYDRIARVFHQVPAPVEAPWMELCHRLNLSLPGPRAPLRAQGAQQRSQITLGTAQLGLPDYGRANVTGQPSFEAAIELMCSAVAHGVDAVDTARAYGSAESVIGQALKPFGDCVEVITKLSPLDDMTEDAAAREVARAVDVSVLRSCHELGVSRLDALLLHRWKHRHSHSGAIWQRLLELRSEGLIGSLGASVSTPDEAVQALSDKDVRHLQLPLNVLDHRWAASGVRELAKQRGDVAIRARSILLQGILVSLPERWPAIKGCDAATIVSELEAAAKDMSRESRLDLCLAYARAQDWVHSLVLGVETSAQLNDLLRWCERPPLTEAQAEDVARRFSGVPEELLNPAMWPAK